MSSSRTADAGGSTFGVVEGFFSDCFKAFVSEAKTGVYSTSDKGD